MKTEVITVDPNVLEINKIQKAVKVILNGGTIAFPTETVYGLGANVFDINAIAKIYEIKKRPQVNPLIVHIASMDILEKIVKNISPSHKKLIEAFWPGPLTILFDKKDIIPGIVTANQNTVCVRWPSHPIAQKIIEYSGVPIGAPSANLSTRPSGTFYKHVLDDLDGKVDLVIKETNLLKNVDSTKMYGIESTIIKVNENNFNILRPGIITSSQIYNITGLEEVKNRRDENITPGSKFLHYSPKPKVIYFQGKNKNNFEELYKKLIQIKREKLKFKILTDVPIEKVALKDQIIYKNISEFIENLYSNYRKLEKLNYKYIIVSFKNNNELSLSLEDRIIKSASEIISSDL